MFTEEEMELIRAAIENRAVKVMYDGSLIQRERDILAQKYTMIAAKLNHPSLLEVVGV